MSHLVNHLSISFKHSVKTSLVDVGSDIEAAEEFVLGDIELKGSREKLQMICFFIKNSYFYLENVNPFLL